MTTLTLESYVFGLDRTESQKTGIGKMRFIKEGADKSTKQLVDRIAGQWMVDSADRNGNIHAECALDIRHDDRGEVAYLYHPDIDGIGVSDGMEGCSTDVGDNHDDCHIATDAPYPQGRDTHWRLCYAREIATTTKDQECWRLRDERTGELWFVQGYTGPMNVNWYDRGTHIFTDGPVFVDDDHVAHFGAAA